MQMQIPSLPVQTCWEAGAWARWMVGEHQVEWNVSKKLETFPIVALIRALLISIWSKRLTITAKVKMSPNIRQRFACISVRNSIHQLELRFHGWNDHP
jgi:hypothetical protein